MDSQVLDQKYGTLTGIRASISELIANAESDEEKEKLYNHLMWHIKNGVICTGGKTKELFDEIAPEIAQLLGQDSTAEPSEEVAKYTAEEAAAYNLTIDGALQYGAIKTPAVEAVEAQAAVLYADAEEYNTAKGTELTDEEFAALDEEAKIKTPAVEAVEAQAAVLYTNEEVDAYNAALPGAKKAGDPKPAQNNG